MSQVSGDVVVVHPGVQHSAELAASLASAGRLSRLITRLQVGDNPSLVWRLNVVRRKIPRRLKLNLPDCAIRRTGWWHEILLRTLSRAGLTALSRRLDSRLTDRFIKSAIKSIGPKDRAVIATDTAALALFEVLARTRPEVARILDVSHPLDIAVQPMICADARELGLVLTDYDDYHPGDAKDQVAELESADVILAASTFSEGTIRSSGATIGQIRRVPYSVDVVGQASSRAPMQQGALRLLALGAMSERKGMSTLLSAMSELQSIGAPIEMTIAGRAAGTYRLPGKLPSNTRYLAAADRKAVEDLYLNADVLVLPSMCEGFGRTLLEALSFGLSVVTTERSGGPDILRAYNTAPVTIVPVGERKDLAAVLRAHQAEPERYLRPSDAVAAAARFSAEHYLSQLSDAIDIGINIAQKRTGSARRGA